MESMQGADPAVLRQQAEGKRQLGQTLMILSAAFAATAAALALTPCGQALSATFYKKAKMAAELAAAAFGLMGMLFSRANAQEAASAASGFVPPNVTFPNVNVPDLPTDPGSGGGSGARVNDIAHLPDTAGNGGMLIAGGAQGPGARGLLDPHASGLGADAANGTRGPDAVLGPDGMDASADTGEAAAENDRPLDALRGQPGQIGPVGLVAAGLLGVGTVAVAGGLSGRRGTQASPDDEDDDGGGNQISGPDLNAVNPTVGATV
jgi:hypothetical protein